MTRFAMMILNILYLDVFISHIVRFFPSLNSWAPYFLTLVAVVFTFLALSPTLIKRIKIFIVSLPISVLVLAPMLLFHSYYHAPLFTGTNIGWTLITMPPALLGIAVVLSFVNLVEVMNTQKATGPKS